LGILAKLYTYVNDAVFEDFAGEAITACRRSLNIAATQISARPSSTTTDGQLFIIKHLLLLKETVRTIDTIQVDRAVDFTSSFDALSTLLRNTATIFNPTALAQLASKGLPNFAETMKDAKQDLDSELKLTCELLIAETSGRICSDLNNFLNRCGKFLANPVAKDLPSQEWADNDTVAEMGQRFHENAKTVLDQVFAKMKIYLDDERAIDVLLPPIQDLVVDAYSGFYNLVLSEYDLDVSSKVPLPSHLKIRLNV